MEFKDRLKDLRTVHKLTQSELSRRLNINRTSISKYENGVQIPEIDVLKSLAAFFNVSVDYLLGNSNSNVTTPTSLSKKEKADIAKDLDEIKQQLLDSDELMFDGMPMDEESITKILSALEVGMEMVRKKNKEKYTPKKYKR